MNRKEFKKLLIEWNQLLCEESGSESKILYHGSPYKFDKFEAKSHFLDDDKPVVFGTPIRSIAIASLCVWTDKDFEQGIVGDDPPHMIEMYPGAFEKIYGGKKGYLYEVSGETFYTNNNLTRYEMISDESPKIIRCIEIEDALEALNLSDMQMVMYEEGEKFRKNDYMFDLDNLVVYTAVTPESEANIMEKGLLNAVTLIKDPKAVAMARPDPEEREKFIQDVKAGRDEDHYNGTSVFFGEPDLSKITDEHFIKKWNLVTYKINLGQFLKDYPNSYVKGVELVPVISKWNDLSDEDYNRKLEELGYDMSKGWDETKERRLSLEEIRAFGEKSPEAMWRWYDVDEHAGKYYAANVPHGFIMSEIGRIPPKYIEKKRS